MLFCEGRARLLSWSSRYRRCTAIICCYQPKSVSKTLELVQDFRSSSTGSSTSPHSTASYLKKPSITSHIASSTSKNIPPSTSSQTSNSFSRYGSRFGSRWGVGIYFAFVGRLRSMARWLLTSSIPWEDWHIDNRTFLQEMSFVLFFQWCDGPASDWWPFWSISTSSSTNFMALPYMCRNGQLDSGYSWWLVRIRTLAHGPTSPNPTQITESSYPWTEVRSSC